MNFEVALAMQRVATGETVELTKGQIAEQAIDLNIMLSKFSAEKAARCKAFYDEMIKNEEKTEYDVDTLTAEIDAQRKAFMNFVYNEDSSDQFVKMIDAIEELLINSPFEGLDTIAYGIAEVCIFSELEFFTWKKLGLDHEIHRSQYRQNLVNCTEGEAVADFWMKLYDDLQVMYGGIVGNIEDTEDFRRAILACSLISLAAIKDQDREILELRAAKAMEKAQEILDELNADDYDEGLSDITDNAVAMLRFVYGYFVEEA